jgi:hypothetical protein
LTIARRPALDLGAGSAAAAHQSAAKDAGDLALDPFGAFDVPAFLRREG